MTIVSPNTARTADLAVALEATRIPTLVGVLSDLPRGESLTVDLPGAARIALFHTDDGVFALDDQCTHQDASLADGWVEDGCVECPLHESCFDLSTGEVSGPPAKRPVRTHLVEVVGEQIWVTPAA